MAEQWRVVVVLNNARSAGWSATWHCKRDLAREIQDRTGGAVVVVGAPSSELNAWVRAWSRRGEPPVSAYTSSRAAAETAAQVAREVTGQHGMAARVCIECWRSAKKQWVDAASVSESGLTEEHDDQERADRRLSAETGVSQWRVRVELRSHHDAVFLAQRLSNDGSHVDQRWKTVLVGAESEDDARRLAEEIRRCAPAGADVLPERSDTQEWQTPSEPTWW